MVHLIYVFVAFIFQLKRKNAEEVSQQNKRLKNERDILVAKILEQYRKEKKEQQEPTCSSFLTPDKKTTKVFTCLM